MREVERCGYLGKERFATKEEAANALKAFATRCRRIQPRCPFCDGFHLTKGLRGRPGKSR